MKSKIAKVVSITMALGLVLVIFGCASQGGGIFATETLKISHAGSLKMPFEELKAEFEKSHPNVDIVLESGGSAEIISRAITQEQAGESPPDIIASADYQLIPDRLYQDGYANWYIAYARNSMVLCYCDDAPGVEEIISGTRSWYDVLRNDPVSYGHSNPDKDPCGYRTLMVIQLAQKYYHDKAAGFDLTPDSNADGLYDALISGNEHERGRTGGSREIVSKKSVDLVVALQTHNLDYAFEYRSVAVQHGLNFIELDDHINLSKINTELPGVEDFYQEASIGIMKKPGSPPTYATMRGSPIVYGITIVSHAENKDLAVEFIKFLLSEIGKNDQPFIEPPLCDHPENLPDLLKEVL